MATQTSIDSYNEDIKNDKELTQSEIILAAFEDLEHPTPNNISRYTEIPVHTVCARLNWLKLKAKVKKTGKTIIDSITKKDNELWEINDLSGAV